MAVRRVSLTTSPFVGPDAGFEKAVRKNNILMDIHLFGDGSRFGLARVAGTGNGLPLDIGLCDLVDPEDDLVDGDGIRFQMVADDGGRHPAESGLATDVVAGEICALENVIGRRGNLDGQDREKLLGHIGVQRLIVGHGHVCQNDVGMKKALGDLILNGTCSYFIH